MSTHSVRSCLSVLGLTNDSFLSSSTLADEFSVIKRAWFARILVCHPDKGGTAAEFKKCNEAFDMLRHVFELGLVDSFANAMDHVFAISSSSCQPKPRPLQSWEFYSDAAREDVPRYRVEIAKSGRSACAQTKRSAKRCTNVLIPQGTVRVGTLNSEFGIYGKWLHLSCWTVPASIWKGLPNPDGRKGADMFVPVLSGMNEVLLSGMSLLPPYEKAHFIAHMMDKGNWEGHGKEVKLTKSGSSNLKIAGSFGVKRAASFDLNKPSLKRIKSALEEEEAVNQEYRNLSRNNSIQVKEKVSLPVQTENQMIEPIVDAKISTLKNKTMPLNSIPELPKEALISPPKTGFKRLPSVDTKFEIFKDSQSSHRADTERATEPTISESNSAGSNENAAPLMAENENAAPAFGNANKFTVNPIRPTKQLLKHAFYTPPAAKSKPPLQDMTNLVSFPCTSSSSSVAVFRQTNPPENEPKVFDPPRPGINGCKPNTLRGQTIVLSGIFPELGGGTGLALGKSRMKQMCESFGARVAGSVSPRTSILVVGKEPGFAKVSKARGEKGIRIIGLRELVDVLEGRRLLTEAGAVPLVIERYSNGAGGRENGIEMLRQRGLLPSSALSKR